MLKKPYPILLHLYVDMHLNAKKTLYEAKKIRSRYSFTVLEIRQVKKKERKMEVGEKEYISVF